MRSLQTIALTLAALCCGSTALSAPAAYINQAVADPSRPGDDRSLDADRKPAAVLAEAGVRPGEIIGEYLPGGGYYTRLLSDIVGPKGKVYALETTSWGEKNIEATKAVLAEPGHDNVLLDLAPLGTFHLPEKVDLFWTTLNYHDLHIKKEVNVDLAAFNKLVFDSLRPGGVYFIADHAATPGSGDSSSPTLHRIDEAMVIQEVKAAGFELVAKSDLLHNPADDHTRKVFDPSIRMKTDQFILKFRKPPA
jgi:predicted methyltransferase